METVVVVDDSRVFAQLLSKVLDLEGYRPVVVTTPEDVANVVLYLCHNLSDQIQGQTVVVDGGYSILA